MIPVTVIGGYLGAGKTTAINALLAGGHGRRLAVLVNDFGAVNIDAELIVSHDGDTIALTNGCVCCTIADALGEALDKVIARKPPPEHIVIEASGVADPAKVAMYGQGWPGLRLDAVITMVDGETIAERARDKFVGRLVQDQLSAGDLVLLTRTDLLNGDEVAALRRWLAARAPGARVLEAPFGAVPADLLLAGDGARQVRAAGAAAAHDEAFISVLFEEARPFERADLLRRLDGLPTAVLRAKGLVHLREEPGRAHVLQRVGARTTLAPGPPWGAEPALTQLVMIGPKTELDAQEVSEILRRALPHK